VLGEAALLRRVVSAYGFGSEASCRFLSRGAADIYRVTAEGTRSYLKVFRPPETKAHAEAGARLVARLAEAGIPVVRAIPRSDGAYASEVRASEGRRPILLFEEAPPPLPEVLDPTLMQEFGTVVAHVHERIDADGTAYDLPAIDLDAILAEKIPSIERFVDQADLEYLNAVVNRIRPQLAGIPREAPEWGVCHADLVLSNVRGPQGVTLFDFGDAATTYRGLELAVVFWSLGHRYLDQRDALWSAFLDGYQTVRALPDELEARLPAFLALREISFLGGNAATLPLRLGTEPFESDFMRNGFDRIRSYLGQGDSG